MKKGDVIVKFQTVLPLEVNNHLNELYSISNSE